MVVVFLIVNSMMEAYRKVLPPQHLHPPYPGVLLDMWELPGWKSESPQRIMSYPNLAIPEFKPGILDTNLSIRHIFKPMPYPLDHIPSLKKEWPCLDDDVNLHLVVDTNSGCPGGSQHLSDMLT